MDLTGKVVVVTGAGGGIGAGLARRARALGARVVVVDRDPDAARAVAAEIDGVAHAADVGDEDRVRQIIDATEHDTGPIALYCSNAGILQFDDLDTPDADWDRVLGVNLLSHVYVARALVPRWLERGDGRLLITASAAGLLAQPGSATYTVSKHAARAYAEYLALMYGDRGVAVHCLCPQAVRTDMLQGIEGGGIAGLDGVLDTDTVAGATFDAMARGDFLVLPHPEVGEYVRRKAQDPDWWLRAMQRLRVRFLGE